ncbi:MAG: hypothetical protein ACREO3_06750 [Arenimonas sp.]
MAYRLDLEPEHERLRITTSGRMGGSEFRKMTAEGLAAAIAAGVRRVLVDHRAMVPAVAAVDIHDLPQLFEQLGVGPDLRIATLIPVEHRALFDFFQALVWNRGEHHFRNFVDESEAISWLAGN